MQFKEYLVYKQSLKSIVWDKVMMKKASKRRETERIKRKKRNSGQEKRKAMSIEMKYKENWEINCYILNIPTTFFLSNAG